MKTRNDELFIYDILRCCENIGDYTSGVAEQEFQNNQMLQDAVVRNIEIIGEAAKNLSHELKDKNPQISWREISRMRDKIVHHYFKLNLDIIWQTISKDIPELKAEVERIRSVLS